MKHVSSSRTFVAPLDVLAHQRARQFGQRHRDRQKAKQVYLNTLAIAAVDFYLHCMGFETDLTASDSTDPLLQSLLDIADLHVHPVGKLECRPVLPNLDIIQVPPEACSDRIGVVGVQLEPSLHEATLLGFTPACSETLAIPHLRSLDDLVAYLHELEPAIAPISVTHLTQWLQGLIGQGWQSLESLVGTQPRLADSFRSHRFIEGTVSRAKLLDLGLQLGHQAVAILVAIAPEAHDQLGVSIQLHPVAPQLHLPPHLNLSLLSESGERLQDVQSRHHDNYIQLRHFRGQAGERFTIQVTLNGIDIAESFVI